MSLADVANRRVFASVTGGTQLTERYVPSDRLHAATGAARPEAIIYQACTHPAHAARLHVEGSSGSGKTSLIFSIIGQLASRCLPRPVQPLIVNTGGAGNHLDSNSAFLDFMLDLIATQNGRFATLDTEALARATAEQVTHTPRSVSQQGAVTTPVFRYQVALTQAITTLTMGRNAAKTEQAFKAIIDAVAKECRPLVVIDDTDHFAGSGRQGEIDQAALTKLYHHGVHTLAEYEQLDLIVAIQPRFRDLPAVSDVESRFAFTRVEAAQLPADTDELTLTHVLSRRLKVAGMDDAVSELIDDLALSALQGAYFTREGDLRWLLDRTHEAAMSATEEGATTIGLAHVQPLLRA